MKCEKIYKLNWLNINKNKKQIHINVSSFLEADNGEIASLPDVNIMLNEEEYINFYNMKLSQLPSDANIGDCLLYLCEQEILKTDPTYNVQIKKLGDYGLNGE